MTSLIGLAGYAKSGKTTLANMLTGYKVASFAGHLKHRVDKLFDELTEEHLATKLTKEVRREVYVAYGRAMRTVDQDYWIGALVGGPNGMAGYQHKQWPHAPTVIDDTRYKNEVDWILSQGGIVLYIARPNTTPANTEESNSFQAMHAAHDLPVVWNDGTTEHALRQITSHLCKHGMDRITNELISMHLTPQPEGEEWVKGVWRGIEAMFGDS